MADAREVFVFDVDFVFAAVLPVFVRAAARLVPLLGDAVEVLPFPLVFLLVVAPRRPVVFFLAVGLAPPCCLRPVVCAIGIRSLHRCAVVCRADAR
ncbi:MAG TPA: hypothetical protein VFW98_05630 [Gemmatimonadaceae bacterium]|nr:hypothetical protein [Gemmatimonadaceae bacterium]